MARILFNPFAAARGDTYPESNPRLELARAQMRAQQQALQAQREERDLDRQAGMDRSMLSEYGANYRSGRGSPPIIARRVKELMGGLTPQEQQQQREANTAAVLAQSRVNNAAYDSSHGQAVMNQMQEARNRGESEASIKARMLPRIEVQATADAPLRVQRYPNVATGGSDMGRVGAYDWNTSLQGEVRQRQEDVNAALGNMDRASAAGLDLGRQVADLGAQTRGNIDPTRMDTYQGIAGSMQNVLQQRKSEYDAAAAARQAAIDQRERLLAQGAPVVNGMETYVKGPNSGQWMRQDGLAAPQTPSSNAAVDGLVQMGKTNPTEFASYIGSVPDAIRQQVLGQLRGQQPAPQVQPPLLPQQQASAQPNGAAVLPGLPGMFQQGLAAGAYANPGASGQVEPGNIDVSAIRPVRNPDGSVSTVRSIGVNVDGKEVLIPTVVNGRVVSNEEAIGEYMRTGKHLGKFGTPAAASAYAERLHQNEAARIQPMPFIYSQNPAGEFVRIGDVPPGPGGLEPMGVGAQARIQATPKGLDSVAAYEQEKANLRQWISANTPGTPGYQQAVQRYASMQDNTASVSPPGLGGAIAAEGNLAGVPSQQPSWMDRTWEAVRGAGQFAMDNIVRPLAPAFDQQLGALASAGLGSARPQPDNPLLGGPMPGSAAGRQMGVTNPLTPIQYPAPTVPSATVTPKQVEVRRVQEPQAVPASNGPQPYRDPVLEMYRRETEARMKEAAARGDAAMASGGGQPWAAPARVGDVGMGSEQPPMTTDEITRRMAAEAAMKRENAAAEMRNDQGQLLKRELAKPTEMQVKAADAWYENTVKNNWPKLERGFMADFEPQRDKVVGWVNSTLARINAEPNPQLRQAMLDNLRNSEAYKHHMEKLDAMGDGGEPSLWSAYTALDLPFTTRQGAIAKVKPLYEAYKKLREATTTPATK
jgi:hypothetical protein